MKVIFSSNRNPHFKTFVEYIENAFKANDCETVFFENRDFIIPGRIRDRINFLHKWDLRRINKTLLDLAHSYKPDIFLEGGGWNILPETLHAMRKMNITTALWTIDVPWRFGPIKKHAPHYDYVFTQGSEAFDILRDYKIKNLYWMPFACDPDFHKPVTLTEEDKKQYACDVCFVGSGGEGLYPNRRMLLESLVDFNLGVWGPGWETLPNASSLRKFIRGGHTRPEEWIKIYSASNIVLCIHFHDPSGKVQCYQASPRVYEVMACGAFLLVDGQRDLLELFKPGEDLVVFQNEKELRKMVKYYLQHPEEANRIAANGRKKVLGSHKYRDRVKDILSIVGRSNS